MASRIIAGDKRKFNGRCKHCTREIIAKRQIEIELATKDVSSKPTRSLDEKTETYQERNLRLRQSSIQVKLKQINFQAFVCQQRVKFQVFHISLKTDSSTGRQDQ